MSTATDNTSAAALEGSPQGVQGNETAGSMQIVSFRLGQEEYGIGITKVREIILMGEITQIPQTAEFVEGVINLRNTVIPIIDLRKRFSLPMGELTEETRIIVVNVDDRMIGIVVDAVSEVLRIANDQIAPPPPTVTGLGQEYLTGLIKIEERLLILLDIDRVLGDATAISATSQETKSTSSET